MNRKVDVLVVGAGPAGLGAAIAASQKGFTVMVAEGARPPLDKACGEGMLPEALDALEELGVKLGAQDGISFSGIRFINKAVAAEASFETRPAMGVRRLMLHRKLLERAERCGVQIAWGTPVTGISDAGVLAGGREIETRWIVGADGTKSRVRKWSGLDGGAAHYRYASRRHYRVRRWSDFMEVYWGQNLQVYVTPVGMEELCVVVIGGDRAVNFDAACEEFPILRRHLQNAAMIGRERGGFTATYALKRVCNGRVALVGDASGGVDAITAQGLALGFEQALALGRALESNDLESYQAAHRRLSRRPAIMGKVLLQMAKHATVRGMTMQVLSKQPKLFSGLLAFFVGEKSQTERFGMNLKHSEII